MRFITYTSAIDNTNVHVNPRTVGAVAEGKGGPDTADIMLLSGVILCVKARPEDVIADVVAMGE